MAALSGQGMPGENERMKDKIRERLSWNGDQLANRRDPLTQRREQLQRDRAQRER